MKNVLIALLSLEAIMLVGWAILSIFIAAEHGENLLEALIYPLHLTVPTTAFLILEKLDSILSVYQKAIKSKQKEFRFIIRSVQKWTWIGLSIAWVVVDVVMLIAQSIHVASTPFDTLSTLLLILDVLACFTSISLLIIAIGFKLFLIKELKVL